MLWSLLSAAVPDVAALGPGDPLPVCPDRPNCVCSEEGTPEERRVDPLPFGSGSDDGDHDGTAWAALRGAVGELGGTVESDSGSLMHAVFKTPVLRFPDDLHARSDAEAKVIQVRSSSRVGRSDLGANRRRVERLREAYTKRLGEAG